MNKANYLKPYKRRSIRLKEYDYSSANCYFITICCAGKRNLFGRIYNGKMVLNEYGEIAKEEWFKTAEKRVGIELDEFIVMPNHIHGIIIFTEEFALYHHEHREKGVCDTPLQSPSHTLGAIIRGYKSAVTSKLKSKLSLPIWQRNYYEHIIRNEHSFKQISDYISNNPMSWTSDRFFMDS